MRGRTCRDRGLVLIAQFCFKSYGGMEALLIFSRYRLAGDPAQPPPPLDRMNEEIGRNLEWKHYHARDVLLVCDKWEYPWPATWDLGSFHEIWLEGGKKKK